MSASSWQQEVAPELLYRLITEYDQYIQQASKNECFKLDQWVPLNIEEFYQTEFKLLNIAGAEQPKQPEQRKEATDANHSGATTWSTFSKQEILATKPKRWWRRWLPW